MSGLDRRQYHREYNRSPQGQARRRRWERSRHGLRTRRNSYQERKAFLDQIKAETGCSCGERNPKALSFVPRDPGAVKFPPWLQNAFRSLRDWKEIIAACDVLCRNCLAKKRRSRKPVRGRPQNRRKCTVNAVKGRFCEVCGGEIKASKKGPTSKPQRRFCSDRCRLLNWASRELEKMS